MFWSKEFIRLMRETSKEMVEKIDKLTTEVSGIKEKLAEFKALGDTIEKTEKKIEKIDKKLEDLENKVDKNTVVIDRVKKDEEQREERSQAFKISGMVKITDVVTWLLIAGAVYFVNNANKIQEIQPQDTIYLVDVDRYGDR